MQTLRGIYVYVRLAYSTIHAVMAYHTKKVYNKYTQGGSKRLLFIDHIFITFKLNRVIYVS